MGGCLGWKDEALSQIWLSEWERKPVGEAIGCPATAQIIVRNLIVFASTSSHAEIAILLRSFDIRREAPLPR
jgi:hypothetical protein